MKKLRLGTRGSRLAQIQAREVAGALTQIYPDLPIQTKIVRTGGDRHRRQRVENLGPGVFVRELEAALLEGSIDLAVHSLKDLPTRCARDLGIAAIPGRCEPREALVSAGQWELAGLPPGSRVGTSSLRREAQLRAHRADLQVLPLRGNVNTRLLKVQRGELDAAILAAAGLVRLQLSDRISQYLDPVGFPPAPGQGCLAVQIRRDREDLWELLAKLDEPTARSQATAERQALAALESGCLAPVGAWAREIAPGRLALSAMVSDPVNGQCLQAYGEDASSRAWDLGTRIGTELLNQGAGEILAQLRNQEGDHRE